MRTRDTGLGSERKACVTLLSLNDSRSSGISLVVFLSRLPRYACQFIEMCLMVTADHGPAVSGAHNTIVCARAGKDLISSLTSGLLTIVSTGHMHTNTLLTFLE